MLIYTSNESALQVIEFCMAFRIFVEIKFGHEIACEPRM